RSASVSHGDPARDAAGRDYRDRHASLLITRFVGRHHSLHAFQLENIRAVLSGREPEEALRVGIPPALIRHRPGIPGGTLSRGLLRPVLLREVLFYVSGAEHEVRSAPLMNELRTLAPGSAAPLAPIDTPQSDAARDGAAAPARCFAVLHLNSKL